MENNPFSEEFSRISYGGNQAAIMVATYGYPPMSQRPKPIRVYSCKYCRQKFLNSRAYGGHQNAHKKERRKGIISSLDLNKMPATAAAGDDFDAAANASTSSGSAAGTGVVISDQQSYLPDSVHSLDVDLHL